MRGKGGDMGKSWVDNRRLHDTEVAKMSVAAKQEMNEAQPEVEMKYDPTLMIKIELAE